MRLPFSWFKKEKPPSSERMESVRSLFSKFQRIQRLNTKALEKMSEMERALGGEYIFDRAFLESSVRDLGKMVYQVVYSLNTMSDNRYTNLFDQFQTLRGSLEDILDGGFGPYGSSLTLPYGLLSWDMEPLVGAMNVCIAEARNSLGLLAPDGFAVTSEGCRLLIESNALGENGRTRFPESLEEAVLREIDALFDRLGGPVFLSVRACPSGADREEGPDTVGLTKLQRNGILDALIKVLREYLQKTGKSEVEVAGSVALAVNESINAFAFGNISSIPSAGFPTGLFRVLAVPADSSDREEEYFLKRTYPYELVRSKVREKPPTGDIYPGISPLTQNRQGMYRGSALLGPQFKNALAECAAGIDRVLGWPFELTWARSNESQPIITGMKYVARHESPMTCDLEGGAGSVEVLLTGGETVQAGIAAGRTFRISDHLDPENVPRGAIAVARTASPGLSPILHRVAALITEVGTSVGHLATIARELRIPAVFGARDVVERLPEGIEVTLDAGERTVYAGIVESLLACRDYGMELFPDDPEYKVLRRLLRWITPLDLIDPDSNTFSAQNCLTYHDLIHFSHEKSVEELLTIQDKGLDLGGLKARRLGLEAPIDIFVLDLGGGLAENTGELIQPEDIASAPFRAFVRGLGTKDMWQRDPASLKFRDIFSGLDRTFSAMSGTSLYAGRNHAIIGENYMNVGLRLGYHFSIIDCYIGETINQNYLYFRFVGGLADEARRRRRAELIASFLDDLRFKTTIKGDLVVGKLKMAEAGEIFDAAACLGELTAFTRQLDLAMKSDDAAKRLAGEFSQRSALGRTTGKEGQDA